MKHETKTTKLLLAIAFILIGALLILFGTLGHNLVLTIIGLFPLCGGFIFIMIREE
jgi:hypothetical protein